MDASNQIQLKEQNRRKVLRALLRHGTLSRTDLCQETNLTRSGMSTIIAPLLQDGLVTEADSTPPPRQGAGRPPVSIQLVNTARLALAVDIAVNGMRLAVVGMAGKVLRQESISWSNHPKPAEVFQIVEDFCLREVKNAVNPHSTFTGIGVSVPGLVQVRKGVIQHAPNLDWKDVSIPRTLGQKTKLPVYLDNNVNMMALAEFWYGQGSEYPGLFYIHMGPGVGCGIIIPHLGLLRGGGDGAGELGHCTVLPDGPFCRCGKRGCLESLVSPTALVEAYADATNAATTVHSLTTIVQRAEGGEETAQVILRKACRYMGTAIATVLSLFDPPFVILDGHALATSPLTRSWIEEYTVAESFSKNLPLPFSRGSFGSHQALLGTATTVFKEKVFGGDYDVYPRQ